MKIITMLNEKGGVGKTTLATHIAAGLAILGKRVVLVDADPQANSTIAFGLAYEPGLYNLVVRHAAFKDVLRVVSHEVYEHPGKPVNGLLAVLPSNIETRNIANSTQDVLIMRKRLREIADFVDIVVIDTSPTPSMLNSSIFMATDAILFPTECEYMSLVGLKNSIDHMLNFKQEKEHMNLGTIDLMGIIPTMYRDKTVGHSTNLEDLRADYSDMVWEPLAQRIDWSDATLMHRPVWNFNPRCKAAKEAWKVVNRVVGVLEYA